MAKALLLALIGFLLPVLSAVTLGPRFFPGAFVDPVAERAHLSWTIPGESSQQALAPDDTDADSDHATGEFQGRKSFASFPSDVSLDPIPERSFVLSFQVKFHEFPPMNRRQKIIAKYDAANKPHIGWAVGVRRLRTSFRPELYWQGADGRGGWYSFDSFDVVLNRWYTFTVVAVPGNFLNVFVEPSAWDGPSTSSTADAAVSGVESSLELVQNEHSPEIAFAGGYSIAELAQPNSTWPLLLAPVSERIGHFRGELGELVLAQPVNVPSSRRKLENLLRGGVRTLASSLQTDEISLWLDSERHDRSRFRRVVAVGSSTS